MYKIIQLLNKEIELANERIAKSNNILNKYGITRSTEYLIGKINDDKQFCVDCEKAIKILSEAERD